MEKSKFILKEVISKNQIQIKKKCVTTSVVSIKRVNSMV